MVRVYRLATKQDGDCGNSHVTYVDNDPPIYVSFVPESIKIQIGYSLVSLLFTNRIGLVDSTLITCHFRAFRPLWLICGFTFG